MEKFYQKYYYKKNSRKARDLIKKVNSTGPPPRHPNPLTKANELANDFANGSKSSNLSPITLNPLQIYTDIAQKRINTALHTPDPIYDQEFTNIELDTILQKKKRTAPGQHYIHHLMIHYTNEKTRNQLLTFFYNLYANKSFPAKWKKALQVAIPKIGKKDQFRPISLLNCISKVYESMILNRARNKIKHKLNKRLFGFNQNRGTRDALITLTEKITKPRFSTNTRPSIVVFIDFEKAFELANPTIITDEARRLGIKGNLAFIHKFLNNRSGAVKFQNSTSNFYPFENGTPQGSVISPFLFNLLINRLLFNNSRYIPKIPKTVTIASYAEDLVIIGYSQSIIQKALNSIASKANKIGLKINITKTDFMLIYRKTKPSLVNKNIILKLNDQKLNQVYHKKYLGVIFDTHLKFNQHLKHITKKANNKINILRKLSGVKWGIDSETALTFVKASIIPTL